MQTQNSSRSRLLYSVVALVVAFAFGRYTAPDRIEIKREIVTVEVENKQTQKDQSIDQNKKTTEIHVTRPDGTTFKKKITQTEKKTDTQLNQTIEREKDTTQRESKVVETSRRLSVSVIAGPDFTNFAAPIVFGGHISRPFIGPISLGIWGLNSGVGGMSLGLQF